MLLLLGKIDSAVVRVTARLHQFDSVGFSRIERVSDLSDEFVEDPVFGRLRWDDKYTLFGDLEVSTLREPWWKSR